ncbi:hypothetical protein [Xenorhabdus entomophaga]|uniref:hypothetical protein n=1 Tax=Xenorhabdus entomophaga TaxID=3136257 RepID=UPI0030F4782D
MKDIEIRGAHFHNLKNINPSIPKNTFIVATGVSGSGKSSFAVTGYIAVTSQVTSKPFYRWQSLEKCLFLTIEK